MSPAGIWRKRSSVIKIDCLQKYRRRFSLKRKIQTIIKILRTVSLKWYPKGVPSPRKSQDRWFIQGFISEFPFKHPEVNHLLDSGLPWKRFWGLAQRRHLLEFDLLPCEIIFKISMSEDRVLLVAVDCRKEVHQAVRKSLQRRLRDWAAVVLYSGHAQQY